MNHEEDLGPIIDEIRDISSPLNGKEDLQPLIDRLEDKRYVLLGEATHGTSEFYRMRAMLTKLLVQQQEISFIAVEGDWPDIYRINKYVKHEVDDSAFEVLSSIERWPSWMWANWETLEFIEWLREYNRGREKQEMVGFYGLDVYSLNESMDAVVDYLSERDPELAERAEEYYKCFEPPVEGADYAERIRMVPESCEKEVLEVLSDLRRDEFNLPDDAEKFFDAEQNALIAKNAEKYYRSLIEKGTNSWNVRDRHMYETLERLMDREGAESRSIVWAHNSHVGDSRATDMKERGTHNLGKLVREEKQDSETAVVGFSSYVGKVVAADNWGSDPEEKNLPPARRESYDNLLNRASSNDKIVFLDDTECLREKRGHRAVGVVYHPDSEASNYVPTRLADRYNHLIYIDETSAVHPIKEESREAQEPETYPWGV